jgi:lysophospholipase L1-like esterase
LIQPHTPPPAPVQRPATVMLIGDSMGEGLEPQLRALFGSKNVIAHWKRGTRLDYWTEQPVGAYRARAATFINQAKPDIIIFALGTNDAVQRKSPQASAAQARILMQAADGRTVIWAGQPDGKNVTDRGTARAICEAVIGSGGRYLETKDLKLKFYDGIHPTPYSFRQWAEALYAFVKKVQDGVATAQG